MSEPEEPSEQPTTETETNGEKELKTPGEDSEKEEVLYYTYKDFLLCQFQVLYPFFAL